MYNKNIEIIELLTKINWEIIYNIGGGNKGIENIFNYIQCLLAEEKEKCIKTNVSWR